MSVHTACVCVCVCVCVVNVIDSVDYVNVYLCGVDWESLLSHFYPSPVMMQGLVTQG